MRRTRQPESIGIWTVDISVTVDRPEAEDDKFILPKWELEWYRMDLCAHTFLVRRSVKRGDPMRNSNPPWYLLNGAGLPAVVELERGAAEFLLVKSVLRG